MVLVRSTVTLAGQVLVFMVGVLAGHGPDAKEYCIPGLCNPTLKVKSPSDMRNKMDHPPDIVDDTVAFTTPVSNVGSCLTAGDLATLSAATASKKVSSILCVTMDALPQLLAHTPGTMKSTFRQAGTQPGCLVPSGLLIRD